MTSYSKQTKETLKTIKPAKKCCERIYNDVHGLENESDFEKRLAIIINSSKFFKCEHCFSSFLRCLFISFGNVTDPSKQYHLELSFQSCEECMAVKSILDDNGFSMSYIKRKNRHVLYVKSSQKIEDFFITIGANSSVFDLMNAKIEREIVEDINRQTNCDLVNIRRTLKSSKFYIDVINKLKKSEKYNGLSAELKETAELRIENEQASLRELALLHNPPITKSGVKHRLDKIVEYYESLK